MNQKFYLKGLGIILCMLLGISCQQKNSNNDSLINLALEEKMGATDSLVMSELFRSIDYVNLESSIEAQLDLVKEIIPTSNGYLISTYKSMLKLFGKDGKYLRDIGKIGKGPGEYVSIGELFWDEEKEEIIVYNLQIGNLLIYTEQGEYLRSVDLPYPAQYLHRLNNGDYFGVTFLPVLMDTVYGRHFLFNEESKILTYWTQADEPEFRFPPLTISPVFCAFQDIDLILPELSDTIYQISKDEIKPFATLGLGDLLITEKTYYNPAAPRSDWDNSVYRITPKPLDDKHLIIDFEFMEINYVAICNVKDGSVKMVSKPRDGFNLIPNDLDGALPIIGFSHMSHYNNQVLQAVSPVNLKSIVEEKMFPDMSPDFIKLISELDEYGNPLLTIHQVK